MRNSHAIGYTGDYPVTAFMELLKPSRMLEFSSRLYETSAPVAFDKLSVVHVNEAMLLQMGVDYPSFKESDLLCLFSKKHWPMVPISTVYAGHQFGIYTSKLGDGRVHIMGDIATADDRLWELQLKGAGATPFARGNNGRLSLAEAITEYLGCEALAGLGIPGTRGLALIIMPDNPGSVVQPLKQAIFVRTAETHLRFGHFEYLYNQGEHDLLKELADQVIDRYYPELIHINGAERYRKFLFAVTQRTAQLVAKWQAAGFVHSVMNTDNMSIIGITMDYGVYGFMEKYDPGFSANDNDDQQRYAFNQQVDVARWNCLALAEALQELLPGKSIPAELLRYFRRSFSETWITSMRHKLGLSDSLAKDNELIYNVLELLEIHGIDYTFFFHQLSYHNDKDTPELITLGDAGWQKAFQSWFRRYNQRLALEAMSPEQRCAKMLSHNPKIILRQKMIEQVIEKAEKYNNFQPFQELLVRLKYPFSEGNIVL